MRLARRSLLCRAFSTNTYYDSQSGLRVTMNAGVALHAIFPDTIPHTSVDNQRLITLVEKLGVASVELNSDEQLATLSDISRFSFTHQALEGVCIPVWCGETGDSTNVFARSANAVITSVNAGPLLVSIF